MRWHQYFHAIWGFILYHIVFYWARKTERIAAHSTAELFAWGFKRLFKKGTSIMVPSDDVKLGSVGDLVLAFSAGKASLSVSLAVPQAALTGSVSLSMDAGALVDALEAAVAKAVPATAAFDPAIFGVLKAAVLAIQ